MHRGRVWSFHAFSECVPPHTAMRSLTWKLSKPCAGVFSWGLPHTGTMDQIMDHWQLIQPLILLPSGKVVGWTESANPVIAMIAFPGHQFHF